MPKLNMKSAIAKINLRGALLVYPIQNRAIPNSIWRELLPKKKMVWDWNDEGGSETHDMWRLMKRLSVCKEVVYSKWYQGRATFFSREFFAMALSLLRSQSSYEYQLSPVSAEILSLLESDSPLSTKQIKAAVGLQGKLNEPLYQKSVKALFQRLQIVAFGEVDDGAFPSLAIGATKTLYEDLWLKSEQISKSESQKYFANLDESAGIFVQQLRKIEAQLK